MSDYLVRDANGKTIDPMWLKERYWPSDSYEDFKGQKHQGVKLYDKQVEIVYSTEKNIETVCVAGV